MDSWEGSESRLGQCNILLKLCAPGRSKYILHRGRGCGQEGYCQRRRMSVGTLACVLVGRPSAQHGWNADGNLQVAFSQPQTLDHKSSAGLPGVFITVPSGWFLLNNDYSVGFGKFLRTFSIRPFLIFIFLIPYLFIPQFPSDCLTVKICVQLKSVAKHQRARCMYNKDVLQRGGDCNHGWNFQICDSKLSA